MRVKLAALSRFHATDGKVIEQTDFKRLKRKNYVRIQQSEH